MLLAEIADKMLTSDAGLLWGVVVCAIACLLGSVRRYLLLIPLTLVVLGNMETYEDLVTGPHASALLLEVGQARINLEFVFVNVPALIGICLALPVSRLVARQRAIRSGLCTRCSYDLRASFTSRSARCPECGLPIRREQYETAGAVAHMNQS